MPELDPLRDAIPLSQAIPEEYISLKEGDTFAITAILTINRVKGSETWNEIRFHGVSLPDGKTFVKHKTSATAIVRKCEDLLHRACFADGKCKKPVRVLVTGVDGTNGRYLDLVDA